MPVQYGGGLRTREAVDAALAAGAERVILGTAAFTDPELLRAALHTHGAERVLVSVDVRGGLRRDARLAVDDRRAGQRGDRSPARAGRAPLRLHEHRPRRDARRSRPRGGAVGAAEQRATGSVILLGRHRRARAPAGACELRRLRCLDGVIVGKALYEQRFTVAEARCRRSPADRLAGDRYGERVHFKRVIPCLDVDGGRVVKGVEFLDIRDAGDPVELAATTTARAPTSWCSSTSRPRTRSARRSPSSRARRPTTCSCRSRSAAASARSPTPRRCSTRARTRCRSTPPRWSARS